MARIWKGGCIIRAKMLDGILSAFREQPELTNLLLAPAFAKGMQAWQPAWRRVVGQAARMGVATPVLSTNLAYFDSYRSGELPQNLPQAQRDAFGAHTYQRRDQPEAGFVHSDWTKDVA